MSNLVRDFTDIPRDLAEEVLSRVSLTSLRKVGSTCKEWNALSKDKSFAKKHIARQAKDKEFMVATVMDYRVYLMRINLGNDFEPCIQPEGILTCSIEDSDDISQIFYCEGMLLCITKDKNRLVLWNMYYGQPKWIDPPYKFPRERYLYAFGYESCHRSHKILSFIDMYIDFKIYDCKSNSWRVMDVTPDWEILPFFQGVSLKGNTYWFARDYTGSKDDAFLVGFDFTDERFGPRLPLTPGEWYLDSEETVALSTVREEQLALLYQQGYTWEMEIWITTKIEPNIVSWNRKVFLSVKNMIPLTSFNFKYPILCGSFLVDKEKKVAVICDKNDDSVYPNVAYVVGVEGLLNLASLGGIANKNNSYFPSLLQLY